MIFTGKTHSKAGFLTGLGWNAQQDCFPAMQGLFPVNDHKFLKKKLRDVPELVFRCFPVLLKKIPNQIIFPFLKLVRENGFLNTMERKLQLLSIPRLPPEVQQPVRTISRTGQWR